MHYVDFTKTEDGNLRITWAEGVTDGDKQELRDLLEERGSGYTEYEAIEYQLENVWELVQPENIGALTSSMLLCEDAGWNDDGAYYCSGHVYWYPDYQIRSWLDVLLRDNEVILTGVD